MTTTTNIACNAEEWKELSDGEAYVSVQLSKLGKGYLAVTDTGSEPGDTPDDDTAPFHRIVNREPGEFGSLVTGDKVWIWLPIAQTVAVTKG